MSSNAAIAAVTATLTNMIQAAVAADDTVSSGTVTARPPDRARQGAPVNQVNLFLYRTSIDAAWRNQDPPSIRPGESGQPPLPLVLSYLITPYGEDDDEILAHRLLGIVMSVLNDRPLLSRTQIGKALAGSGLESQVERVRVIADPRPQDEISRMWVTFGTGYRLSVSYDAAVVLIDSVRPVVAPTPVLMRGRGDTGPAVAGAPFPAIQLVAPPNRQPAAQPGDVLTLTGTRLDAVTKLTVSHPALSQSIDLAPLTTTPRQVTAQLPDPPTLPAGVATVVAAFDALMDADTASGATTVTSNGAPVALAPKIVSDAPLQANLAVDGSAQVMITCSPPVQKNQTIALVVGSALVPLAPVQAASTQLSFTLKGIAKGTYTLRLRIDSVDSIPVVIPLPPVSPDTPAPMTFDPHQQLVVS
jgi:hypothetical protein